MQQTINTMRVAIIFIILHFSFNSCTDTTTTPGTSDDWGENKVQFQVTWDENAIRFDASEMSDIKSIDSANYIFHFKPSSQKASSLTEGDVIIINDYVVRKVSYIENTGDEIYVETEFAALTEAIKDGIINWDYGVEFTPELITKVAKAKGYEITVVTTDSIGFSIKVGSYEYTIWMKLLKEKAIITVIAEKEIASTKVAKLTVQGELKRFRTKGNIKISNNQLDDFENRNSFKETDITLSLSAAGSGNDIGIEVPLPLLPPFPIAGIPFFLFEIKALIVMNASVPPDGSSLIAAKFRYTAEQGFRFVKGDQKPSAIVNLQSNEFDKTSQQPHTGASGPVAISWGIAAPRFEITLGGTTVAWVHAAYLLGGDYVMLPKPCQRAQLGFYGAYGWALGGFGLTLASGSGNLWKHEKVILKAGDCD